MFSLVKRFVNKTHRRSVSQALTVARNKLITIARSIIMPAYDLYPQEGSTETPDVHRIRVVRSLIDNQLQRLLVMHNFTVDEVSLVAYLIFH